MRSCNEGKRLKGKFTLFFLQNSPSARLSLDTWEFLLTKDRLIKLEILAESRRFRLFFIGFNLVAIFIPLEVSHVLLQVCQNKSAIDGFSVLLHGDSDCLFFDELDGLIKGNLFLLSQTFVYYTLHDFLFVILPRFVDVMSFFLKIIVSIRLFEFCAYKIFNSFEKSELSDLSITIFSYVLSNTSDFEIVAIFFPDFLTKTKKLFSSPFKFMIETPHLSFLEIKEVIEVLIWCGNEAKLGP